MSYRFTTTSNALTWGAFFLRSGWSVFVVLGCDIGRPRGRLCLDDTRVPGAFDRLGAITGFGSLCSLNWLSRFRLVGVIMIMIGHRRGRFSLFSLFSVLEFLGSNRRPEDICHVRSAGREGLRRGLLSFLLLSGRPASLLGFFFFFLLVLGHRLLQDTRHERLRFGPSAIFGDRDFGSEPAANLLARLLFFAAEPRGLSQQVESFEGLRQCSR